MKNFSVSCMVPNKPEEKPMRKLILAAVCLSSLLGCATIQPDQSRPAAVLRSSIDQQLGFNRITAPVGTLLQPVIVDGRSAYCTVDPAYFAAGDQRSVCFMDYHTGSFDRFYVAGTLRGLTYETHAIYAAATASDVHTVRECNYEAIAATASAPYAQVRVYQSCLNARANP